MIYLKDPVTGTVVVSDNANEIGAGFSTWEVMDQEEVNIHLLTEAKAVKISQLKLDRDSANVEPIATQQGKEIIFSEGSFIVTEDDVLFKFVLTPTGTLQTEAILVCFGVIITSTYYPAFFARYVCNIIEGETTRPGYIKLDQTLALKLISFARNRMNKNASHYSTVEQAINSINIVDSEIPEEVVTYEDALLLLDAIDTTFPDQDLTFTPPPFTTIEALVGTVVSQIIDYAPEALNTLNELAAALGDDPNFATTITNLIASKATAEQGEKADTAVQPVDLATLLGDYVLSSYLVSELATKFNIPSGDISQYLRGDGTLASFPLNATSLVEGLMSASDKNKLDGIANTATANSSDATLLSRANHTGTQTTSTISNFVSEVNALIEAVIDAAPSSLNTLNELATALGNDPNYATTISTALATKITGNTAITGATKTKVIYDSKGLVTGGEDATTADIADTADKRYCTDAEKTKLTEIASEATVNTTSKEGITSRVGSFPFFASATVSGGVAVFYLTVDGTAGGAPIFTNGYINGSINLFPNDSSLIVQIAYALTNSNKTLTATVNKATTSNLITGVIGQAAANGVVVNLQVWGY